MKVLLVLKNKDKELRDQMKDKDVEVEQLKAELTVKRKNQKILLKSLKKLERSIMI